MKQTVNHHLSMAEAQERALAALQDFRTRYPGAHIHANWHSDTDVTVTLTVRGFKLRPHIRLRPGAIDVELDVPLIARPFEAKARARIEQELTKWLRPTGVA